MRPPFDDLDEFDFSDSMAVCRIRRELMREERRPRGRRFHGPGHDDRFDDFDDFDEFDDSAFRTHRQNGIEH